MAKKKQKHKHKHEKHEVQAPAEAPVLTIKGGLSLDHKHWIVIAVVAFVLYANSLMNGFCLDDTLVILGNSFTKEGFSGILDLWTHDMFVGAHGQEFELTGGRYRPLSLTTFAIEYHLFGPNAFVGHLGNVVMFSMTGVMIYAALRKVFPDKNQWLPLITALIFVAHPLHTEVVANIKSRDEVMSLLFLLGTIYFLFKDSGNESKNRLWGLICFFLSLLSKEISITAMAIIPIMFVYFRGLKWKKAFVKIAPYLGVSFAYLFMRQVFSGGFSILGKGKQATNLMDNPYMLAEPIEKISTIIFNTGQYLKLCIFPYPLSYDYSYNQLPVVSFGEIGVLISLVVIGGLLFLGVKSLKNHSVIGFGILFFFLSYSLVSNLVFNIGTCMGERFIYMASLGACISLAALIIKLTKIDESAPFKFNIKAALPLLIIVPIGGGAIMDRNMDWKDNNTLYKADIKTVPNSGRAQLFIGIEYLNEYNNKQVAGALDSAVYHITRSTEIYPEFYHAHYNLGLTYQAKQDHESAIRAFTRVLEIQPNHINSHYFLGMSLGQGRGDTKNAIKHMETGIKYGYNGADAYVNLGIAYGMSGNFQAALAKFQEGLTKTPQNAGQLYKNIGITYSQLGDKTKAAQFMKKAQEFVVK